MEFSQELRHYSSPFSCETPRDQDYYGAAYSTYWQLVNEALGLSARKGFSPHVGGFKGIFRDSKGFNGVQEERWKLPRVGLSWNEVFINSAAITTTVTIPLRITKGSEARALCFGAACAQVP